MLWTNLSFKDCWHLARAHLKLLLVLQGAHIERQGHPESAFYLTPTWKLTSVCCSSVRKLNDTCWISLSIIQTGSIVILSDFVLHKCRDIMCLIVEHLFKLHWILTKMWRPLVLGGFVENKTTQSNEVTLLGTSVKSGAVQYNSYAKMFHFWWHCQAYVHVVMFLPRS